jgi:multicomponent Na+:H+ antiporter subunit E
LLRAIGLGVVLLGFWLALSGHYTPMLISFGVGSSIFVVWVANRMDVVDHEGVPLHLTWRFLVYFPWLMKEVFVANLQVAKLILDPKMPISPRIVVFHGSQVTDLGRVIYANSITLTPGTITTGVEGKEYQIHALSAADLETGEEVEMNVRCTWVEQGKRPS